MTPDSKSMDGLAIDNTPQAICYKRGSLQLLDQRKLPLETVYIDIQVSIDGWKAIRDMVVRGAPAIAIAAALSLAVEIGTYSLALCATCHHIPFYDAAPVTSIDLSLSSGKKIVIEERSAKELLHSRGLGEHVAASSISVWIPAFDDTPANLTAGIITEKGVITKNDTKDAFDIKDFIEMEMSKSTV
ncbi:Methylthioribose-1-phosphate isomerase [Hibiscus syriacus]|uniref:Methylthioribose-1-phosphate isomerase n=1 Tax=Hibiscus syriacus TaxID=106335 RepID=A0A6A2Y6T7_HIBSY|nr:Methylthioribose-1-phosphate isomerase [Hibiscus syriacus]